MPNVKRMAQKKPSSKGFFRYLFDLLIFQPGKSSDAAIWRDMYRAKRQLKELDRIIERASQPSNPVDDYRKRGWL